MVSVLAAGVDPAAMHMHPHLDPAISSSSWPAYVHRLDDPALDCEEDELCKFLPEGDYDGSPLGHDSREPAVSQRFVAVSWLPRPPRDEDARGTLRKRGGMGGESVLRGLRGRGGAPLAADPAFLTPSPPCARRNPRLQPSRRMSRRRLLPLSPFQWRAPRRLRASRGPCPPTAAAAPRTRRPTSQSRLRASRRRHRPSRRRPRRCLM